MARKRYSEEDILRLLGEIAVHLHRGMDVVSACCTAGISDKTYYRWRKRYGGLGACEANRVQGFGEREPAVQKDFGRAMSD